MSIMLASPISRATARGAFWTCALGLAITSLPLGAQDRGGGEPGEVAADSARVTAFVGVAVPSETAPTSLLPDRTVLVAGDRIVRVGRRDSVPVPAGARRVDGEGRTLVPGLADMHVHLEYFDDPEVLGLFLANGVTTVRNMDGRPYLLEWKRAVEGGEIVGPAIFTAGPLLDGDPPILPDNAVVANAAEARRAVREQAAAGYDFIKVYSNLSSEAYEAVLRAAAEAGLPVAGHVPGAVGLDPVIDGGQISIEHLAGYGDGIEARDSPFRDGWHWSKMHLAMPIDTLEVSVLARRLGDGGVWTVPTLVQSRRALAPADTLDTWLDSPELAYIAWEGVRFWEERVRGPLDRMDAEDWAIVDRGARNRGRLVAALHDAGAGVLAGTDTPNPFVVPGFSIHEELALLVAAGLSPADALDAATRGPARFLGELDEWGTIAEGKRADLLLVEGNPLDDIGALRRIAGVMARGRWLPREQLDGMLAGLVASRPDD